MWAKFETQFSKIEGFTVEMQRVAREFVMNATDVNNMEQQLEAHLKAKFGARLSVKFFKSFHHYWNFSMYQGMKSTFGIKDGDIKVEPKEEEGDGDNGVSKKCYRYEETNGCVSGHNLQKHPDVSF